MMMLTKKRLWKICIYGVLLCLVLAGCASVSDVSDTAQKSPVTLRLLTVGSSGEEACQRISRALSAITQKELGFSVELEQASLIQYKDVAAQQLLLNNAPDLFCYINLETLSNYVEEGYVYPLDGQLKNYSGITRNVPSEVWSCVQIEGATYAVPANNHVNYSKGFLARADIVQQMGINPAEIDTWEELHEVLLQVKEQFPDMIPVVGHFGQVHQTLGQDPLGDNLGVLLNNKGTTIENLFASEQYAQMCQFMHQWYEEDLILKDIIFTDEAAARMMNLYNGFGFFTRISDNNISASIRSVGQELVPFVLSEPIANSSSVNLGWCVSPTSQYKQQALQLLELLYTEQAAADLCIYGEENTDYVRLDKNTVTNKQDLPQDEWSTIPWAWPNRVVASTWRLPEKEVEKLPTKGAIRSPAMGFVFNSVPVQTAVNRCLAVVDKYHEALMSGYLDPQDALPRFLAELEEAGIETVIAEKQRQLNRWLNA
ncbi:MAG: ABC transporter substrate-binding protein [Oscillospiraceae bacterium]|nr:ABC transporter substrate-binding protein [Oscillospiraceae bacterium]